MYRRSVFLILLFFLTMVGGCSKESPLQVPEEILPPARDVLISQAEIDTLSTSGPSWDSMVTWADRPIKTKAPDLSDVDDNTNIIALAKALVYARLKDPTYKREVKALLKRVVDTEVSVVNPLAVGRQSVAYVFSADVIDLEEEDPFLDKQLREKLGEFLPLLEDYQKKRPNNFGVVCGASRIAILRYLGSNKSEFEDAVTVFKGWLGDRNSYAGFKYGNLSWQCDTTRPVGVNPVGCIKYGRNIDGVVPDDQRRTSLFGPTSDWPPPRTNYAYGSLGGALVTGMLLYRAGYRDVWSWQDQAILRIMNRLSAMGHVPEGDDEWVPHVVNRYYGSSFPVLYPAEPGKVFGFADWWFGPRPD